MANDISLPEFIGSNGQKNKRGKNQKIVLPHTSYLKVDKREEGNYTIKRSRK